LDPSGATRRIAGDESSVLVDIIRTEHVIVQKGEKLALELVQNDKISLSNTLGNERDG
jgi:hypothetical protein